MPKSRIFNVVNMSFDENFRIYSISYSVYTLSD